MIEFRRILCPVDFSDATPEALSVAAAVARAYDAEVLLLHVLDFPHRTVALERYYLEIEDEAKRRLNALRHEQALEGLELRDVVQRGTTYDEIVRYAGDQGVDLIVMATHGRRGLSRLIVGSVTERVARTASCPLLAVPPTDEPAAPYAIDRVLFATDFSKAADAAMPYAMSVASHMRAALAVVHVVTLGERGEYGEGWEFPVLPADVEQEHLRQATEDLESRAGQAPEPADARLVRGTYPAIEIAEHAVEIGAGMIVAATHGHSAIGRALLGSTTEKLIRYSPMPVLVARQD